MIGYGIFTGCGLLFLVVCLYVRRRIRIHDVKDMIYGGGSAGGFTLTCSILTVWMWTTSVFGSAETYALYGIWGPISYVTGACIAFVGLIGFILYLRKRFPGEVTWLGYIRRRYGESSHRFYYIFAVIVPAYVLVEQGVGIAYVLETFYGISFKIISFLSVLMAMAFVFFGGMRSVLVSEKIATAVILAGFLAGVIYVAFCGQGLGQAGTESAGGLAQTGTESTGGLGALGPAAGVLGAAIRYFIMAIVIAFSQIIFDPGYYIKADLAKNQKVMAVSFGIGGIVLWGGITLAAALYLGRAAALPGISEVELFDGIAKAAFSVVIIFIGVSTIIHFMIGWFGVFSLDLFDVITQRGEGRPRRYLRRDKDLAEEAAPRGETSRVDEITQRGGKRRAGEIDPLQKEERERIVFGRILLVAIGLFCASMTIALENISLLTIDVFCAIFFAAPCVPLVFGCFSQRNFGRLPVFAVVLGIVAGLLVWIALPGTIRQTQFAGMGASLLIPLVVMMGGYLKRLPYDG